MILERYFSAVGGYPNATDDFWYRDFSLGSSSVKLGSEEQALTLNAVWSAIAIRSQTLAALPLTIKERLRDGSSRDAVNHPLYDLLKRSPTPGLTSFEWREGMATYRDLRGNAYSRIVPGRRGAVDELVPLAADRMTVENTARGHRFRYSRPRGGFDTFLPSEIFHIRGLSLDGVLGLSPISIQREIVEHGLGLQRFAKKFFDNGARPGGVLETDAEIGPEGTKRLRREWAEIHQGADNAHRVAVLEEGMKWHAVSLSNEDAQFLESRTFSVVEIARMFRIPPHKMQILDRATFDNVEHLGIEFVVDTMLPEVRRWEEAIDTQLITNPDKYFAHFNLDGLLRGDVKTRFEAYRIAREIGVLNANEIRKLEDLNARTDPEGDVYLTPLNMGDGRLRDRGGDPGAIGLPGVVVGLLPAGAKEAGDVLRGALLPIIREAASRVANMESREIAKKASHESHESRFRMWLVSFLGRSSEYMVKVIAPIAEALDADRETVDEMIETLREAAIGSLSAIPPGDLMDPESGILGAWAAARNAQVERAFLALLLNYKDDEGAEPYAIES